MDAKTIEKEALHLPLSARADLAHKLLLSLDDFSPTELEEVWLDEAERRAAEVDSGQVDLVPSEVVSRKAQALLR